MDNVVNLNRARKAKAREEQERQAAENRVRFGRKKSDSEKLAREAERRARDLNGHKLTD